MERVPGLCGLLFLDNPDTTLGMSKDIGNYLAHIVVYPVVGIRPLTEHDEITMMVSRLIDNGRGRIAYLHNFGLNITACSIGNRTFFSKKHLGPLNLSSDGCPKGQAAGHSMM